MRRTKDDASIRYPSAAHPYPGKAELVLATPAYDGGGNYGRLPRCKPLMDDFMERSKQHEVLGIAVANWILFLRRHSDTATPDEVESALQAELQRHLKDVAPATAAELLALLEQVGSLLRT